MRFTKLGAKWAELVQKFVPRSRFGIFTTKAPDPPHWTLNSCFGVFHTIWVHLGPFGYLIILSAKRVELVQKVCATKSRQIFSQRTHPIHPTGPELKILVRFILFGCIWDRLVALRNSVQNVPN